jgi:HemK-like putative methylase
MTGDSVSKHISYSQEAIIKALAKNKTVQVKTPHGLDFILSKGVFIMGNEAFEFIDLAKKIIHANPSIRTVGEIGTGSGVVIATLAKMFPNVTFYGCDISKRAILLSSKNILLNNLKNVTLYLNKRTEWVNPKFPKVDLLLSNPPYLGNREYVSPDFKTLYPDYSFQPKQALRSYETFGFKPYFQIVKQAEEKQISNFFFQCNPTTIKFLENELKSKNLDVTSFPSRERKKEFLLVTKSS